MCYLHARVKREVMPPPTWQSCGRGRNLSAGDSGLAQFGLNGELLDLDQARKVLAASEVPA